MKKIIKFHPKAELNLDLEYSTIPNTIHSNENESSYKWLMLDISEATHGPIPIELLYCIV